MEDFKTDSLDSASRSFLYDVDISRENKFGLYLHFDKKNIMLDMNSIIQNLFSCDPCVIYKAVEDIGFMSKFPGEIAKLKPGDVQRIFTLATNDLPPIQNNFTEYEYFKKIKIHTLKTIYEIFKNSKTFNAFEMFTSIEQFNMAILFQLPNLYVPLILSFLFEYDNSNASKILGGLEFIEKQFCINSQHERAETYFVIQVIRLLFDYEVVPDQLAIQIINEFNQFCWKDEFCVSLINLFIFDFFRQIDVKYLAILSQTNFFENSITHFTTLSISRKYESFYEMLKENTYYDKNIFSERGMTVNFDSESMRTFFLETVLKIAENGFSSSILKFIPDLFNNAGIVLKVNKEEEEKSNSEELHSSNIVQMRLLVNIAKNVIPVFPEIIDGLQCSNFQNNLSNPSSYVEKELIIQYFSLFLPFGMNLLKNLNQRFKITELCFNILQGDNSDAIIAALNFCSIILKSDADVDDPLIVEIRSMLSDDVIMVLLQQLNLYSENEEIKIKSLNLCKFIQGCK